MKPYLLGISFVFTTSLFSSTSIQQLSFTVHIEAAPDINQVVLEIVDGKRNLLSLPFWPSVYNCQSTSYRYAQLLINQQQKNLQSDEHGSSYDIITSPIQIMQIKCITNQSSERLSLMPHIQPIRSKENRDHTSITFFRNSASIVALTTITTETTLVVSHAGWHIARITQV